MDEKAERKPGEAAVVSLRVPIEFGKLGPITELVIKPSGRAYRDLTIPMTVNSDGSKKIDFQPYPLAVVGLKMAGHVAEAQILADRMDPKDMTEVALEVMGFTF